MWGSDGSWQDTSNFRCWLYCCLLIIILSSLDRDTIIFNYFSTNHPLCHPCSYFCCGSCYCCGSVADPWTIIYGAFSSLSSLWSAQLLFYVCPIPSCDNDGLLYLVHHWSCDRISCINFSLLSTLWSLQFIVACLHHPQLQQWSIVVCCTLMDAQLRSNVPIKGKK